MRRAGLALFLLPATLAPALVTAGCGGGGGHGPVRNGAIAAVETFGGGYRVVSVDVNGSHLRRLTSGKRDSQPAWAPDGRSIAFVRCAKPNSCGIYTMRRDGTHVRAVRGAFGYSPSWSPDGRKLLFFGQKSLQVVNRSEGGLRTLNAVSIQRADWSPDGRRVAYANLQDVYVIDVKSRRRRPFHVGQSLKSGVAWSPDGREIAFVRASLSSFVPTLMVVRPDDSGLRRIRIRGHFTPALDGDLDWSPDGRWLVLRAEYGSSFGIYVVRRSGGRPRLVLDSQYLDPSWQAIR